ncbi:cytochrome P450 [Hypoxylon trugodes]|uniref:cytochrome P450 n=1 Tax=Hypoxylon trugodes TaxID=326681 RepID=UPI00219A239D|nr:cytochrome P450 [Hypoxylon trugodes]KAI1389022.1 cytochrome P450 [Hypoxylon trugodes]
MGIMATITTIACVGTLISWLSLAIYRVYLHPLRHYPGSKLAVVSNSWWEFYWNYYRNGELIFEIERLHNLYGPVIRIGVNDLHVNDPEVFQDLARVTSPFVKPAKFYQAISIPGTLIGELDPARHRLRRKVLSPAFMGDRVHELALDVLEKTKQLVARFETASVQSTPICITAASKAFTMDIISKIVFGEELGCVTDPNFDNEFSRYLEAAFKIGWTATAFPMLSALSLKIASATSTVIFPLPITSLKRKCLRITTQYISQSSVQKSPNSRGIARIPVIDRLMDPNAVKGHVPPSLDELNDELVMLLIAGNDTTSTALIFGIYKICTCPVVEQRLTHELIEEFPSLNEEITYDRVRKLPYLTATIKEILRLGNPLPGRLPRMVPAEGYYLHGRFLQPGVNIHTSAYVLNRQPEIWPKPNEFNPDRWTSTHSSRLDKHLATFYKGPRQCLGKELAWCELLVAIANIFRRFRIEPYDTTDHDMEWKDLILVVYRKEFLATVERRTL